MNNLGLLTSVDYTMIVSYLAVVVAIGCWLGRGQATPDDYFVAGRRMHWFPLGLSIWASLTSANSMLGAPSYGYSQDLQYVIPIAVTGLFAAAVTVGWILPLLQPLGLTTAYTYLELRFGLAVRCLGSALFVLVRGSWLASVIYAPSLALSAVIPIPAIDESLGPLGQWCGISGSTVFWIAVVGMGATVYTTLGGLTAVIWTDVIQFFVFVVGLAAIWFLLLSDVGGGNLFRLLGKVPRAYAGRHIEAVWGETVRLDGTQSISFDGSSLEYQWRQVKNDSEYATVQLLDAQTPTPQFVAPQRPASGQHVTLTFVLRVTTSESLPLQSSPSVVQVTVKKDPHHDRVQAPPAFHEGPHDTTFDFSTRFVFGTGVTF